MSKKDFFLLKMFKCSGSVFLAVFLLILLSNGTNSQNNKKGDLVGNEGNKCIVPAADVVKNGRFRMESYDDDEQPPPGTKLYSYVLEVTCNLGYTLLGEEYIQCITDRLNNPLPKCIGSCQSKSPGLLSCGMGYNNEESQCLANGPTLAAAKSSKPLQCGLPGELSFTAVANGTLATLDDAPWHAGVYQKTTRPFMQICGGTIISANVIISAAHCFWSDINKKLPARNYAVAVGKLYRPWDNTLDIDAQKSDIKEIRIPPRFQGSATNFQDDIAALVLVTPLMFSTVVVPVCLDFSYEFDVRQLTHGNNGRVVGWGLTSADGAASQVLNKAELPIVGIEQCIAQSQPEFLESITSDKICAGYNNGTSVCRGDSGGGLAFEQFADKAKRYFLRGIVSTAPINDHLCNVYSAATFTHILRHEHFIKEALNGNPTPEVEVTTKSIRQLVDEAKARVNKEKAERLNADLQTATKINDGPNGEVITITDMDEPGETEYKPAVFIPLAEYLKKINSTATPCFYTKSNMTACKDLRNKASATDNRDGVDTNVRSQTKAPNINSPFTDEAFPSTGQGTQRLPILGGLNQKVPNKGVLNPGGINQGVPNPLVLNQGVPNQAGLSQGSSQAVSHESINDKVLTIPGSVGFNQVGINLGPTHPELQAVLNRDYDPQNIQGVYNPHGILQGVVNQGPVNQAVPSHQVLTQGVLPQGVSNHAGLHNGVLQQIPLPEPSVDKSTVPMNLHWMTNYDYQQQWQQNSPNNKQSTNKFNYNHQQHWDDSPNNQQNHQNSPNHQQNHQNRHDSPSNQQNNQNWHFSHNWHNAHDHHYNWHQNW